MTKDQFFKADCINGNIQDCKRFLAEADSIELKWDVSRAETIEYSPMPDWFNHVHPDLLKSYKQQYIDLVAAELERLEKEFANL